jgi:hypothetical protein
VSPRARTIVRWLAWIGGVALVVVLGSGLWVTFRYRPDAAGTTLAMVRLHRWSSYIVGLAAVTIMVICAPRPGLRVYIAITSFVLLDVVFRNAAHRLLWDQVGLAAVTIGREVRGMFFLHHPAVFVRVDGHEYSWERFRALFWLHAVVFPLAMAATFVWAVLWARGLRRRQSERESREETPDAIRS